jgi:hypothetical protein
MARFWIILVPFVSDTFSQKCRQDPKSAVSRVQTSVAHSGEGLGPLDLAAFVGARFDPQGDLGVGPPLQLPRWL